VPDALDWDSALERWRDEVDEPQWVTLAEAEKAAGVSRSALRNWYRNGEIPSRLEPGPNGEQRLVPLDWVMERASRTRRGSRGEETFGNLVDVLARQLDRTEERADRAEAALRKALERAAEAEAEVRVLRERIDQR